MESKAQAILLISGSIREINGNSIHNDIVSKLILRYYYFTKIKKKKMLKNCFFAYGTLRDDLYRNRKIKSTKKAKWGTGTNEAYLAIVYGFKMYGVESFPYAVKTNNDKDYIIGRLLHFKNDKKFNKKLIASDEIEGYDPNEKDSSNNIYTRKKVECFIFDKLSDERLEEIGYWDTNKRINFDKSNISKIKQKAYIYYIKNRKKMKNSSEKTPNCDWLKRFEHHRYEIITINDQM